MKKQSKGESAQGARGVGPVIYRVGPVIYRRRTSPIQGTCDIGPVIYMVEPVIYRVGPVTDIVHRAILVRVGPLLLWRWTTSQRSPMVLQRVPKMQN